LALGHVRLSIIGLENGDQPIFDATGSLACVVNGEFYGYRDVRQRLLREGRRFSTESDSEIALHLYDTMGADFVHELRGEFALAIADERSGRLIAARDRFGIKPLFYAVHEGAVLLASEIKALLALGVPARWSQAGFIAEQFSLRTNQTIFAGIHAVPPGCLLIAEEGCVTIRRYWETQYPVTEELSRSAPDDQSAIAGFREILETSVADRLVADVEVACYLSGGIDSCAILGLAQRHAARPIKAFTIAFDDAMYDEMALARKTAEAAGADFIPVRVGQRQIAESFESAIWHAERHMFNGHGVAKYLLSRAVRDAGIKVVFTGEGSDEILAGYPTSRRDLLLFNGEAKNGSTGALVEQLAAANKSSRGILVADGERSTGLAEVHSRLGFIPSWIDAFSTMAGKQLRLMRPHVVQEVERANPYRSYLDGIDIAGRLDGRDPVNQSLWLWNQALFVNYVLTVLGDRMEMAHSIEGRVPFLDHRVTEFAAGLRIDQKIRGTREKYVLREACRDVLIPEVYERQKHPFMSPPARQGDDAMAGFVQDTLRSSTLHTQPFFDTALVRSLLDEVPKLDPDARAVAEAPLLNVVSTCLLQQRFGLQG
jgi:asparagine synthase (glutamine-hydrolysing)